MKQNHVQENSKTPSKNRNLVLAVIGIFTILSSLIFWLGLQQLLQILLVTGDFGSISIMTIGWFLGSYLLFIAAMIINATLIPSLLFRTALYIILASGIFVVVPDISTIVIPTLILLGGLLLFDRLAQFDKKIHVQPKLVHMFGPRLPIITTLISIVIAAAVFAISSSSLEKTTLSIPDNVLDNTFDTVQPLLSEQIGKQQEEFKRMIIDQLEEQVPFLVDIPYEDKAALLQGEITDTMEQMLSEQGLDQSQIQALAKEVETNYDNAEDLALQNPDDLTLNLFQEARDEIEAEINSFIANNQEHLPGILSSLTFIIVSSLGLLLNLIGILCAMLIIKIFVLLSLVTEETYTTEAKRYSI